MDGLDPNRPIGGYDELPPLGMSSTTWRTLLVVVGNVVVLLGVIFFGWSLRSVLLLYWAETVLIGVLCMVRWLLVHGIAALPMVLFFTVHFGMFCFVHLVFLMVLTSGVFFGAGPEDALAPVTRGSPWVLLGLVFLALPHAFEAARKVRAERLDPPPLMKFTRKSDRHATADITDQPNAAGGMPYGRVMVMHGAIIGGAFLTMALGSPVWLLVILVVLKTGFDLAVERSAQKKTHA